MCTVVNRGPPVSEGVGEERWQERDASDCCSTVTEGQQKQGLVGVKVHHTDLVSEKLPQITHMNIMNE